MQIESVVLWYQKNVNYKLTRGFLNFLVNIGIMNSDVDLELLNSFLLETFGESYMKENGRFKIKKNRIPIIDKFKDKVVEDATNDTNEINLNKIITTKESSKPVRNKFKIESLGGKKLKLVKR